MSSVNFSLRVKKILKYWKYWVIVVISFLIFIYAVFNLIPIIIEYNEVDKIYKSIKEEIFDNNTYNHNDLLSINEEGLGYIYIPSINLKLPIAQTSDNDYYLSHTFNNVSNINGCLFEDCRISEGLSAFNVIIYGHNMKSGAMFGKLPRYRDFSFWNSPNNDIFYIFTNNVIKKYKIFSCYISEPVSDTYTYKFSSVKQFRDYALNMKEKSIYSTNIDVSDITQIVTLSTCTIGNKKRFIVHGAYVEEVVIN